jgi:hypothetical protein
VHCKNAQVSALKECSIHLRLLNLEAGGMMTLLNISNDFTPHTNDYIFDTYPYTIFYGTYYVQTFSFSELINKTN